MAPEFRTRPDGTRYPITPRRGAGALVAIGIAVALAGGGAAGGLGASATGGTAVSGSLAGNLAGDVVDGLPGRDLTTRRTEARRSAQRGRSTEAWSRLKLKQLARRAEHGLDSNWTALLPPAAQFVSSFSAPRVRRWTACC